MARIVVVEDEPDVATMLKFMLERDGHSVQTAKDGAEALALLGLEPADPAKPLPDLAILDVIMPVLDGNAVAARMARDARAKSVPVLMLTARGGAPVGRTANVVGQIDKPFDPRALRERVAEILGGAR